MTDQRQIQTTSVPEFDSLAHEPLEPERQKAMHRLLVRATKDEAWRQELINNPKPILEQELGITIPPGVAIQVHEAGCTIHLMLPPLSPHLLELPINTKIQVQQNRLRY